MTEPLCALCGEDRDYPDHAGGELRHEFEAELAPAPSTEAVVSELAAKLGVKP